MKAYITIKGAIYRPSYTGYVEVFPVVPATKSDIVQAVVTKLNRTSYQADKLHPNDIVLMSVEL